MNIFCSRVPRICLTLLLVCCTLSLYSQFKTDSLQQALRSAEGKPRVDILNELVRDLHRQDQAAGQELAREAVDLATSLNYTEGLVLAKINVSTILAVRSDYEAAIDLTKEALTLAEAAGYQVGIFRARFSLGGFYAHIGEYQLSVTESIAALPLAEKLGDVRLQADLLNNIGRVQQILGQFEQAEESFDKAVEVCEQNELEYTKAVIFINVALLSYLQGDLPASLERNKQALAIFEKYEDKQRIGICLNNIGFGLFEQGRFTESLSYYDRSLAIRRELNDLSGVAKITLNKAKVFRKKGDLAQAVTLTKESMAIARESEKVITIQEVRQFAYKLYEQSGKLKDAYQMFQVYTATKDSLFAIDKQKAIDEMVVKFENAKLKGENELALQQGRIKDLKIKQRNYVIGVFAVLAIAVALVFNRRKLIYKHEVTLNKLHLLRSQFRPHFIFNVLNSVNNSVLKGNTDEASEYLSEFAHLMRQDLNAYDRDEISLAEELTNLEAYLNLEKLRFKERLNFEITVEKDINSESVMILPMLLQPVVENSLKHAFRPDQRDGKIEISITKEQDHLWVCISDNGQGLQAASSGEHVSKGLQLVEERLKLKDKRNTLKIGNQAEGGVMVKLKIRLS